MEIKDLQKILKWKFGTFNGGDKFHSFPVLVGWKDFEESNSVIICIEFLRIRNKCWQIKEVKEKEKLEAFSIVIISPN